MNTVCCGHMQVGVFTKQLYDMFMMAERQQRQRLRALRNNCDIARFTVQGRATGKQLGTGSYGSVEEVFNKVHVYCILSIKNGSSGINGTQKISMSWFNSIEHFLIVRLK